MPYLKRIIAKEGEVAAESHFPRSQPTPCVLLQTCESRVQMLRVSLSSFLCASPLASSGKVGLIGVLGEAADPRTGSLNRASGSVIRCFGVFSVVHRRKERVTQLLLLLGERKACLGTFVLWGKLSTVYLYRCLRSYAVSVLATSLVS